MRTLNKPEVVVTLMILVGYLFCILVSDHIFSFVYSIVSHDHEHFIAAYKNLFFIASAMLLVFFAVRLYQKKMLPLQQQYHFFLEVNPKPVLIIDLTTQRFLAANKAAIEAYGYSLKELRSCSLADLEVRNELDLNNDVEKAGIIQLRKKNGEIFSIEVLTNIVVLENKKCQVLLPADSPTVKAAEVIALTREEQINNHSFSSYVIDNIPVDVAVFDKDHRYLLINKAAVKNDEIRKWMIGKNDYDYFALKGCDMAIAEKRRERFLKAIAGESKEWIDEHEVDGKVKYVLRKFYHYYEEGQLKFIYGYGMDITEVKKAQAQRDEYIQQLEKIAFTTSHRIRQPICNLQGLISLVEMERPDSSQIVNIINCMLSSINTLDDFTRDLAVKLYEYKQNLYKQDNPIL